MLLESLLLAASCSLDAFVASIAYGTNKIKIPLLSIIIINIVCSSILAISLIFGATVKNILPTNISTVLSCVALVLLGFFYLFQSIIKAHLAKTSTFDKKVKFKFLDLQIIIDIYIDETKADLDNSKFLNSSEAFYLAVALALDSLSVGFAGGLGDVNYKQVILLSLVLGMVAIVTGLYIGRKLAERSKVNISWLSGILLIILALSRIKFTRGA